jgi:Protein of unknown function (DUF3995)
VSRLPQYCTSAALAAIAGIHVAWGRGSSFPFATHAELTDAVVGSPVQPSPAACNAVAAALLAASALVIDVPIAPRFVRRTGRVVLAGVLGARGVAGVSGRTDALVPGSVSPRFRRLDRRYYGPLCLVLALGAATAGQ